MPNDHETANITCTITGTLATGFQFSLSGDHVNTSTGDIDVSSVDKKVNFDITLVNQTGTTLSFGTDAEQCMWIGSQGNKPTRFDKHNDLFDHFQIDNGHLLFEDKNNSSQTKIYSYMIRVTDGNGNWYGSDPNIINR